MTVAEALSRLPKRFRDKFVVLMCGGCWLWIAGTDGGGYGMYWDGVRQVRAHVYAYRLVISEPGGLDLHHVNCISTLCVNPYHLQKLTRRQHITERNLSSKRTRKEFCSNGHRLSGDNLYVYVQKGVEHRGCRECRRSHNRVRRLVCVNANPDLSKPT